MGIIEKIESEHIRREVNFQPGDTVKVHVQISEGEKKRIQMFQGVVIRIAGHGVNKSFTVRKMSFGIGVERVFPVQSPNVVKVEITHRGKVRRARLYYLRDLTGKKARLKDRDTARLRGKKKKAATASR